MGELEGAAVAAPIQEELPLVSRAIQRNHVNAWWLEAATRGAAGLDELAGFLELYAECIRRDAVVKRLEGPDNPL